MESQAFTVIALPPARLATIRREGQDDQGNVAISRIDEGGGAPLRCCLRNSRPGERILLVAYSPFDGPGPYAETGPVFIHADPCPGYPDVTAYPKEFRSRQQVFRTYRSDGTIAGGRLVDPDDSHETAIAELLADPEVAYIHSRNVVFGCYMFAIHRA